MSDLNVDESLCNFNISNNNMTNFMKQNMYTYQIENGFYSNSSHNKNINTNNNNDVNTTTQPTNIHLNNFPNLFIPNSDQLPSLSSSTNPESFEIINTFLPVKSKILSGADFQRELKSKYTLSKLNLPPNQHNNSQNPFKQSSYIDRPDISALLSEIKQLRDENKQLKEEISKLKQENASTNQNYSNMKNVFEQYEKQNNILTSNSETLSKTNLNYKDTLDKLYSLCNYVLKLVPESSSASLLKENIDYYINNPSELENIVNTYKTLCDNKQKKRSSIREVSHREMKDNINNNNSNRHNSNSNNKHEEHKQRSLSKGDSFQYKKVSNPFEANLRRIQIENGEYEGNENDLYNINRFKSKEQNCYACYLGCGVSRSGYSPMNYNPYMQNERRKESNSPY